MILMIDNYDSFTYNLVQMLGSLNQDVKVFRNDKIALQQINDINPSAMVVSPGPGSPKDSGISMEAIRDFGPKIPILGVCLGHQAIAATYGGRVVRAERIMHGKTSEIFHDDGSIYANLPNPFEAVRYHSLIVERSSLPDCFEISAWTKEGEIMGIRHTHYMIEGVQFHPESFLTMEGFSLMKYFLKQGGLEK